MKTIIVDDEELAIRQFEMECKKLPWVNIVGRFHHAQEALEYVEKEKIEAAFLDIELPGMNGILLGSKPDKDKWQGGSVLLFEPLYQKVLGGT